MSSLKEIVYKSLRVFSIIVSLVLALGVMVAPALAAPESGSISGRVTDVSGNPLANISVNAGDKGGGQTDANGKYRIWLLPFGQYSVISPAGWGSNDSTYISQTRDIDISAASPDAIGIDFVLEKGGSISGTVQDIYGYPLVNISVNVGDKGGYLTDANGNYTTKGKGLPFGQYSVISPVGRGSNDSTYISQTRDIDISAASPNVTGIDFVLEKGGSISGTVKETSGNPLDNISVNIGDKGGYLTDANGNYFTKGLPFGQYSVISPVGWGSNDGTYISQTRDIDISAASPYATGIDFVLVKGGSISGTVQDTSGNPLDNISVNIGDKGGYLTDANGNYTTKGKGLPFGQYSVISPVGWGSNDGTYISQTRDIDISAASPDATGIDFVLEKGGFISGTVQDTSGNPLDNISVNIGDAGGYLTNANGNYFTKGLPFGQYSVISPGRWGSNDGTYISQTRDIDISAASPYATGIDFVLVKGGSISGTVRNADGNPLDNISVKTGDIFGASTDANGYYIMRGLPFAQYSVISPVGWGSNDSTYISQTRDIDIFTISPDLTDINFFLVKGGSISGTVKDATGNPLANISVKTGGKYDASTDANGYYIMRGLPFAQYSVISPFWLGSNDSNYISQTRDIDISAASPDATGIDFVLVLSGSISGTVKDTSGNPLDNVSVNIGDTGGYLTDANGNYFIKDLPPGQYSITSPGGWGHNDGKYLSQSKDTEISETSLDVTGIDFALMAALPMQDIIIVSSAVLCGALLLFYILWHQKNKLHKEKK